MKLHPVCLNVPLDVDPPRGPAHAQTQCLGNEVRVLHDVFAIFDAQTHLIPERQEWQKPLQGAGAILQALSALGLGPLNDEVKKRAAADTRIIPMFHLRLVDIEAAIRELRRLTQDLTGPWGVGEIEWGWPMKDADRYLRLFEVVAEVANGRPVAIDLHTGLISPDAVNVIYPEYTERLKADHGLDLIGLDNYGNVTQKNSALAHDPTHLRGAIRTVLSEHPNMTFFLTHPLNQVGGDYPNPSVSIAREHYNAEARRGRVLLGAAASLQQKEELFQMAVAEPWLWDVMVFQSDCGSNRSAIGCYDRISELTRDLPVERRREILERFFYANAAPAYGLSPDPSDLEL